VFQSVQLEVPEGGVYTNNSNWLDKQLTALSQCQLFEPDVTGQKLVQLYPTSPGSWASLQDVLHIMVRHLFMEQSIPNAFGQTVAAHKISAILRDIDHNELWTMAQYEEIVVGIVDTGRYIYDGSSGAYVTNFQDGDECRAVVDLVDVSRPTLGEINQTNRLKIIWSFEHDGTSRWPKVKKKTNHTKKSNPR